MILASMSILEIVILIALGIGVLSFGIYVIGKAYKKKHKKDDDDE